MPPKKKKEEEIAKPKAIQEVSPVKENVSQSKDDEIAVLKSRLARQTSDLAQIASISKKDNTFEYSDEMTEKSYLDGYQDAMVKLNIAQPKIAETSISTSDSTKKNSAKKAWKVTNFTDLDREGAQI